jgi:hypothetical protein
MSGLRCDPSVGVPVVSPMLSSPPVLPRVRPEQSGWTARGTPGGTTWCSFVWIRPVSYGVPDGVRPGVLRVNRREGTEGRPFISPLGLVFEVMGLSLLISLDKFPDLGGCQ